jgi:hypothetical protein
MAGNTHTSESGGAVTAFGVDHFVLQNTIIQDDNQSCAASGFLSLGGNIDSDDTCNLIEPSDKPGSNPLLGPLADNGGPTQTHALLEGSPAIDAGENAGCPAEDQRGVARPLGNGCDMGAYESPFSATFPPLVQGDINCDGEVDEADFTSLLRHIGSVIGGQQVPPCPDVGDSVSGFEWGDVNCDGKIDAKDALEIALFKAGVQTPAPPGGCSAVGDPMI